MHLSDEILNKYVDNELSAGELSEVSEHINVCAECLSRLKAQRLVEHQLKRIEGFNVADDFTNLVMKKISVSVSYKPKKSYFMRFVFSFFAVSCLAVLIIVFANMPQTSGDGEYLKWVDKTGEFIKGIFSANQKIFSQKTISLVGTMLTAILLASGYFIYDFHKRFKDHMNKLG